MFLLLVKPIIKSLLKPQLIVSLFTFVSLILFTILLCSCVSSGLRHTSLVYSASNNTTVHMGYLGICVGSECSTTGLGALSGLSSTTMANAATTFRDHAIRPYFVLICIFATLFAYVLSIMTSCVEGKMNLNPVALALLLLAWASCVIAAVWQEVAVHSAVVFLNIKKGTQASVMVWTAVALLTIALVTQAAKCKRVADPAQDTEKLSVSKKKEIRRINPPYY